MRKYILLIVLLIINFISYSQNDDFQIDENEISDYLFFNNGEIVKGKVYTILRGYVVFIKEGEKKGKKYKKNDIKKVIQSNSLGNGIKKKNAYYMDFKYRPFKLIDNVLSGEVVKGKVTLYVAYYYNPSNSKHMSDMLNNPGYKFPIYYLKREGEDLVKIHDNNMRKVGSKYFSDCPEMAKKIKKGIYYFHLLPIIVKKYNEECSK